MGKTDIKELLKDDQTRNELKSFFLNENAVILEEKRKKEELIKAEKKERQIKHQTTIIKIDHTNFEHELIDKVKSMLHENKDITIRKELTMLRNEFQKEEKILINKEQEDYVEETT